MALDSRRKLGESTSLLTGFQADIYSVPFSISSKPALFEKEAMIKDPDYDAIWSYPFITLHENAEDLLSAVLQINLRPMRNDDQPSEGGTPSSWPSGALILAGLDKNARHKALKDLSTQLGIELSTEGWSYALVRCTRKVGTATHLCYERGIFGNPDPDNTIRPDALEALKKLEKLHKTSTDVSMDGAKGYLNFYETYGTHFVSSIIAGDSIFQVFAYGASAFQEVQKSFKANPESFREDHSYTFAILTVPRSEHGQFGYTEAAGKICIVSQDEEMAKSLIGGLWRDEKWSGTNSILAPYLHHCSNDVNTTFKKIVPISFELASISIFAEYYRMLIWHRVFKGVMYAKYLNGSGVAAYFSNNCPYDLDAIFRDSDPIGGDGLLSTLCTPSVNILKEKIDLEALVVRFPAEVKKFSIFANAVQLPSSNHQQKTFINVPGSTNVTFLGHVISSGGNSRQPPNVQISDSAFQEIEGRLFCGEFYGGLRISNSDNSKSCVVMNGLMMKYSDGKVTIVRDVRESPSSTVVKERLTDIQFALVVAEARLNFLLANPTIHEKGIELMKRFLLWLSEVTGSEEQLLALKARATYLAKVATSPQASGIPVPLLRYEAYKDVVKNVQDVIKTASNKLTNFQSQIRARMAEERAIEREQALNENIIKSGKLLQEYIATQAEYQDSLESMFQSVFKDKEDEMNNVVNQTKKLKSRLKEQREIVDKAVSDYEDAVADWEKKETIKAGIDIASSLFSLGFTMAAPSSAVESLQALAKAVQKIQKLVTVFDAVIKVYRNFQELPDDPQKVVDALQNVGPNGLETLSALEWDEMLVTYKAVLATGPDIAAKTTLSAAFEILVLRGKALLASQSSIQKIAADLSAVQQRIKLHQDQKKRLDQLKMELEAKPKNLDIQKIDLIGLSGQLLFFQRQMLMTLASTVVIQDRALQYEYLRQPTPVGSFTMMGLQLAILRQSQSITQGLTVQPLPQNQKHPIIYEIHGVRPEAITNNRRFAFNIDINKREFAPFNYVRVESVVVEVDGIVSTDSGKYYTELVFDGDPFYDRGFDGETLTFRTTSRIFTGLQNVNSSSQDYESKVAEDPQAYECTTGRDPFDGKITNITPFSTWYVSLPQVQSNEGIKFGNRVKIRIIFRLYAQLKENEMSPMEIYTKSLQYLARSPPVPLPSPSSNSTDSVTNKKVLGMMTGKSICEGWDVVFSMRAEQVNEQLKAQYEDRKGNPKFLRDTGKHEDSGMTFDFKFDAPKLQFLLNNKNSAQITLPIFSGYFKFEKIHYVAKKSDAASIVGDVDLAIMLGSVSTKHTVVIKLKGGHFDAKNFKVHGIPNAFISFVLTNYFSKLGDGYEVYKFGILDYKKITVLNSLKPTNFLFNVYHTPSNNDLLQLFIATSGTVQSAAQSSLREPIPSHYHCSLIINTKILFQDVLPASLGNPYGLILRSEAPKLSDLNKDKVWASKATAGSVSCPYPRTMVRRGAYGGGRTPTSFEDFVKVKNNKIVVDLEGMTFEHGEEKSSWNVKMAYDIKRSYHFQYEQCPNIWGFHQCDNHVLPVTLSLNTNLPLDVTGSGQNQMVRIHQTATNVYLHGHLAPPGVCKTNDRDLQDKYLGQIKKELPPRLVKIFNENFTAVSLFALKNLLFPAKNLFDMKEAFVPGDMVVFGNFTKPCTPG